MLKRILDIEKIKEKMKKSFNFFFHAVYSPLERIWNFFQILSRLFLQKCISY